MYYFLVAWKLHSDWDHSQEVSSDRLCKPELHPWRVLFWIVKWINLRMSLINMFIIHASSIPTHWKKPKFLPQQNHTVDKFNLLITITQRFKHSPLKQPLKKKIRSISVFRLHQEWSKMCIYSSWTHDNFLIKFEIFICSALKLNPEYANHPGEKRMPNEEKLEERKLMNALTLYIYQDYSAILGF